MEHQSTKSVLSASPIVVVVVVSILLIGQQVECKENQTNTADLLEVIKKFDQCVIQSTFSFIYPTSFPPKSTSELSTICKSQQEGFKCVKEKTRGAPSILRRGLLTYISQRQRHHKKYCTNPTSEISRKFIEDNKCIREKRYEVYKKIDDDYVLSLYELSKRNYKDPRLELQQFCCLTNGIKQRYITSVGQECASSGTIEELANTIIPGEINLICDDDDKLAKICAKLEKIETSSQRPKDGPSPAAMGLYVVATLGEPRNTSSLS